MNTYTHPPGYFAKVTCHMAQTASMLPLPNSFQVLDKGIVPFAKMLYKASQAEYDTKRSSVQEEPRIKSPKIEIDPVIGDGGFLSQLGSCPDFKVSKKDKRMYVGHSGGKDSTVTCLHYIKQGYDVTAVHIPNMNRFAPDEKRNAVAICTYLKIPLIIIPFTVHGDSPRRENPMENAVFLALMVDEGAPKGVAHYALGLEETRGGLENYHTEWDFSDSPDVMNCIIDNLYKPVLPDFSFHAFDANITNQYGERAYTTILNRPDGVKLLTMCRSCMSQYRFRDYWNMNLSAKHRVEIWPGRCGACFKCCLEWLYLQAFGVVKANPSYEAYCWKTIQKWDQGTKEWCAERAAILAKLRKKGCTCSRKRFLHP